jgi:hypothetical protein
MLRLDVNGDDFPADPTRNYAIPPSNPFVGVPGADEIWAYGLREPWRCSFDRETGDLYIADVGEDQREELNVQPAGSNGGENYGWRCKEGTAVLFNDPECVGATLIEPIHDYSIAPEPECSITGGYVYRGTAVPELFGKYIFADFCTSRVWSMRYDGVAMTDFVEHTPVILNQPGMALGQITSFGEDACGELYVCAHFDQVFRIVGDDPGATCRSMPGDFDGDGDVDLADFAAFSQCFGGANVPPAGICPPGVSADLDGDTDVDLADFAVFSQNFTGAR